MSDYEKLKKLISKKLIDLDGQFPPVNIDVGYLYEADSDFDQHNGSFTISAEKYYGQSRTVIRLKVCIRNSTNDERLLILAHELGHYLSWKQGHRTEKYLNALRIFNMKFYSSLTYEQKILILDEEKRAWNLGLKFLIDEKIKTPHNAFHFKKKCLISYLNSLKLPIFQLILNLIYHDVIYIHVWNGLVNFVIKFLILKNTNKRARI